MLAIHSGRRPKVYSAQKRDDWLAIHSGRRPKVYSAQKREWLGRRPKQPTKASSRPCGSVRLRSLLVSVNIVPASNPLHSSAGLLRLNVGCTSRYFVADSRSHDPKVHFALKRDGWLTILSGRRPKFHSAQKRDGCLAIHSGHRPKVHSAQKRDGCLAIHSSRRPKVHFAQKRGVWLTIHSGRRPKDYSAQKLDVWLAIHSARRPKVYSAQQRESRSPAQAANKSLKPTLRFGATSKFIGFGKHRARIKSLAFFRRAA